MGGDFEMPGHVVTVGFGKRNDRGKRVSLNHGDPVRGLHGVLDGADPSERERWWSPGVFTADDREDDRWIAGSAIGVDCDWQDAEGSHHGDPLPGEKYAEVVRAALEGEIDANLLHRTPGGMRLVFLLDRPETDKAAWRRLAAGAHSMTEAALRSLGLLGTRNSFLIDGHGKSPAKMFWAPRTTDDRGRLRDERSYIVRERPFAADELLSHAPPPLPPPEPRPTRPATAPPDLTRFGPYVRAVITAECEKVATARANRNNTLCTSAFRVGRLLGSLGEQADALKTDADGALFQAAVSNGDVDDDGERKSRSTIERSLSAGIARPRVLPGSDWPEPAPISDDPEPMDFPTSALDASSRLYVEALATATETSAAMAAPPYLAVAAYAISKKVRVRTNDGHEEPPNIYVLPVAEPSDRKSSVFADVMEPLRDFERDQSESMRDAISMYRAKVATTKEALGVAHRRFANTKPGEDRGALWAECERLQREADQLERSPVADPQCVASDATAESIVDLLAENAGRIALMSPEAKLLANLTGLYSSSKQPSVNIDILLSAYSAESVVVNRKNRPRVRIDAPEITLCVMVQPGRLRSLGDIRSLEEFGLWSRSHFVLPPSRIGWRTHDKPGVPATVRNAAHARIRALLEIPLPDSPSVVDLSQNARRVHHGFALEVEARMRPHGELSTDGLRYWAGKLPGGVARIALIMHMLDHAHGGGWREPIEAGTMESAIEVGRFLTAHARAAYRQISEDDAEALAGRISRWAAHGARKGRSTFTRREAQRHVTGNRKDWDGVLDRALGIATECGHIRAAAASTGKPDHRTRVYEVSPWLVEKDAGDEDDAT